MCIRDSTAVRDGSSSCRTSCAPGTRRRTSSRWRRSPSAREAARSRQAPASERAASPFLSSRPAASVHGPTAWTFSGPRYSCVNSSRASRSSPSQERARLVSRPGRSPRRQPLGSTRAYSSTSIPAVRPIMSAPGPRAGSSGRWGKSSKLPVTVFAASRASVPGREPMPVAGPKRWLAFTGEAYAVGGQGVFAPAAPSLSRPVPGGKPPEPPSALRASSSDAGRAGLCGTSRLYRPGLTVTSLISASLGRSRAVTMVVATESGSIHRAGSYSLPSCWWTLACMGLAVRPG